jgi:small subunit ribosomal protein S6
MPTNQYECLVLFDASKVSGSHDAAKNQVTTTLEKHGVEIIVARNWDERKLAYPVDGQKKGLYFLTYFKADSQKIDPIQADFKLNEQILRFMTIKIPPKWENEMETVAKDDHRFAYQAIREEEGGNGDDMNFDEPSGGRGRRGRRGEEDKD